VSAFDEALADLEALAAGSLPMSEFVTWPGSYPEYTSRFDRLWPALAEAGFDPGAVLDYMAWAAGRDLESAEAIAAMSAEDLGPMVVAMRRAERFGDGVWASLLERGLFLAVFRRARALAAV
jgi:hypothetical protein